MSLELRIAVEGLCECGIPHHRGYETGCRHDVESDWGTFGDPPLVVRDCETDTTKIENAAPLILVGRKFVDSGGELPPRAGYVMDVCTFYADGVRRFMRFDADNGSWTWELFEAHWADGHPPSVYVGRWPD